jgi:hypothetical protein
MRKWIVIGAVIVVIVALLNLLATVVGSLVPIAVTALIAFLIGRLSVNVKLGDMAQRVTNRVTSTAAPQAAAKPAATLPPQAAAPKPAPAVQQKPATQIDDLPQKELKNPDLLLDPDFEIKTPEQIEAEAREREAQMMQQAKAPAASNVQSALEARRKRLLENK